MLWTNFGGVCGCSEKFNEGRYILWCDKLNLLKRSYGITIKTMSLRERIDP